jgi:hypothetical protein
MNNNQLRRLNSGHRVQTFELVPVPQDRLPVVGEQRYMVPLMPALGEPLAAMMPLDPIRIAWTGTEWVEAPAGIADAG